MIELSEKDQKKSIPNILVIGVGGGGNNAVNRMIESGFDSVKFVAVNTDAQVLEDSKAEIKLQIGRKLTGGYGAGADPSIGEAAARESEEEIRHTFEDANMIILTCGLGGGTGTGAISTIAKICHEMNILTTAVVTLPFSFEGTPRAQIAQGGLESLRKQVDTLLVIPNDKLLEISDKPFFVDEAFQVADNVLRWAISGITNIIFNKGLINLDFNDLCTILRDKGNAHIGIGVVKEGASLLDGVKQAIDSPLLDSSIKGAGTIMLNTSGRINLVELNEAVSYIKSIVGKECNIIWGTVTDPKQIEDNTVVITLIATGIDTNEIADNTVNGKDSIKNPLSYNSINKFPGEIILPPKMPINNSASFLRRDYDIKGKLEIPNFLKNHSN